MKQKIRMDQVAAMAWFVCGDSVFLVKLGLFSPDGRFSNHEVHEIPGELCAACAREGLQLKSEAMPFCEECFPVWSKCGNNCGKEFMSVDEMVTHLGYLNFVPFRPLGVPHAICKDCLPKENDNEAEDDKAWEEIGKVLFNR